MSAEEAVSNSPWPLPETWQWSKIADIGDVYSGGTPSTKEPSFWGDDVVWFSPADLTGYSAKYIRRGAKSLSKEGLKKSSAKIFSANCVMFSSRAPIGYVAINAVPASTNQGFKTVAPVRQVHHEYAYYYLKSAKQIAEKVATGTTFKEISGSAFAKLPFPLPPFQEQKRIVEKIEELFTKLDKGIESLRDAQAQLKFYRQSLLKHAFEGKLTADYRAANLEWSRTNLGSHLEFLTSGSRGWAKYYAKSGATFVRAQNIKYDRLELDDIAFVQLPKGSTEGIRTLIRKDDILITITGANVTKTAVVRDDMGTAYVSQHVALCRLKPTLSSAFAHMFLIAEAEGRKQLNKSAYGAGKPGLNLDNIRDVSIPVPDIKEQDLVVSRLDEKLSTISAIEVELETQLAKADALRQSILKQAFSGKLVPQDPNNEPASVLLERIRAERAGAKPHKRQARPRKAKEAA